LSGGASFILKRKAEAGTLTDIIMRIENTTPQDDNLPMPTLLQSMSWQPSIVVLLLWYFDAQRSFQLFLRNQ
jgi:hypothetical protein